MSREQFYECTFSSGSTRHVEHVRAWDAREAAELFTERLQDAHVGGRGTIDIRDPAGRVAGRVSYPRGRPLTSNSRAPQQ
jgi:hypothetical protein